MLMMMSSTLAMIFTQMNHPLAMGLILLLQTVMIVIITGLLTQSFWFSYILFLIFLGGMLVLFIYVTSLASNEMFSLSNKLLLFMMCMLPIMFYLFYSMSMNLMNQEVMQFMFYNNMTNLPLIKLYNFPTSIITIMLASYLFLTLIAVVSITNIFKGPLRHSY
uniref:NADH-ubiquinone oxidoreductase chain 6 n=1 Tax=Opisthoplatia orientalis TaxID=406672 RepID=A0A2P1HA14_9NEOP|nr:NADH dehydrogenase subunit 6 [Opisthoplatia orientalis]QKK69187.1 NADH dehydrogenase subunit 6 [Opisthoplatia orientalis]